MIAKWRCAGLFCAAIGWAQQSNQLGIAHVAFRVGDLEAARSFYQRLGFEQFFEMKQGERTTEAFLKINDRQFIELYPRSDPSQSLGLMHVCYESHDLEALHAGYVQRGLMVSDVRKAGAGNLLMTMKDPEGQTIEFTQYMPGSRHYEDRGKHLSARRVSQMLIGATTTAHDAATERAFYIDKLGFNEVAGNALRIPGDSRQELDIGASGIQFGASDLRQTAEALAGLGVKVRSSATALTVSDPDGNVISFLRWRD
jgi:catechol 2,3-dioxygenase-like lactoylglutathione lyase family enzyme